MKTRNVLVEVRGGVVVAVYSSDCGERVYLLDWDEQGDRTPRDNVDAVPYPVDSFGAMPADTAKVFVRATDGRDVGGP